MNFLIFRRLSKS